MNFNISELVYSYSVTAQRALNFVEPKNDDLAISGLFSRKENSFLCDTIVSRGDWFGKPANIIVENNGTVVFVEISLTVHNPLFFVLKL